MTKQKHSARTNGYVTAGRVVGVAAVIAVLGVVFLPRSPVPASGLLLFTEVADGAAGTAPYGLFPERSHILGLDLEKPQAPPRLLTEDFTAARAPAVSFDGRRLVFAGRKGAADSWELWERPVEGGMARRLSAGLDGCTDPAYTADDRVVFSALVPDGKPGERALFVVGEGDAAPVRITFDPVPAYATSLLRDGRVLFVRADTAAALYALRHDGTGMELFYRSGPRTVVDRRAWETANDRVLFVEDPVAGVGGGQLATVDEGYPLRSREGMDLPGDVHSAFPAPDGGLLISYRASAGEAFALYGRAPGEEGVGSRLYGRDDYHAVDPVLARAHRRPLGFVSAMDPEMTTGWLYCLDANDSTLPAQTSGASAVRVRIERPDGVLGEFPLEADGSFFAEVPADTPLRFFTLTADGRPVRGPSSWVWVRPNERRGCVGCHEDRELVPANRLAAALSHAPWPLHADPDTLRSSMREDGAQ